MALFALGLALFAIGNAMPAEHGDDTEILAGSLIFIGCLVMLASTPLLCVGAFD